MTDVKQSDTLLSTGNDKNVDVGQLAQDLDNTSISSSVYPPESDVSKAAGEDSVESAEPEMDQPSDHLLAILSTMEDDEKEDLQMIIEKEPSIKIPKTGEIIIQMNEAEDAMDEHEVESTTNEVKLSRKEREWLKKKNHNLDPPVAVFGPTYFTHHAAHRQGGFGPLFQLESGSVVHGLRPTDQVVEPELTTLEKVMAAKRKMLEEYGILND